MKISEALALPVTEETTELYDLKGFYYDHVPELQLNDIGDIDHSKNTRIVIKTHAYHCFDGRRIWRMQSVWFDGKPAMITQNAGREGDDYNERFILDNSAFVEMLRYLFTLRRTEEVVCKDGTYTMNDEPKTLGNFYNHTYEDIARNKPTW